jgi:hypothetical protein
MFNFFHSECRGCALKLEPETVDTVARMTVEPTEAQIKDYDDLIKGIKLSQGLCLQTYSLHQRFITIYIRASHDKQASLLDWTNNQYDGVEVGTIRFTAFDGVGGNTGSYINDNYSQVEDYFSPNSKFGGYVTSDFNNRIMGAETTNAGGSAYEMTLAYTLGNRIYDSWGANPQHFFNTAGQGMREIVRGGTYDNNGTLAGRTLLYQGQIDLTGGTATTVRLNFSKKFYSLANNRGDISAVESVGSEINTVGLCMFQFHGSFLINSPKLLIPVEQYLTKVGAI